VNGATPHPKHKWIYVAAGHRAVRRVDVSSATIRYSKSISAKRRSVHPDDSLVPGAEVEVQAVQDDSGEWKGTSVRILALAGE
jgi:hypothetical protein